MKQLASSLLHKLALPTGIVISVLWAVALVYRFIVNGEIGLDFSVYWRAANEPLSQVYLPRPTLNFPYLPTMLLWIAPLSVVPLWTAFSIWVAVSVAVFIRVCRAHLDNRELALALVNCPMAYCLLNGQVSAVVTATLIWACVTHSRIAAGIALAVIASIKPQFVLLAPLFLLVTRDWRALGSAALTLAVIVAVSLAAFGVETWQQWFQSLDHFHDIVVRNGVLTVMVTPAGVAELWGLPPLPFMVAGGVLGAWLVVRSRDHSPLIQATAIAAGSMMAAPYAIMYDLVAVVPFLVLSIFRGSILSAFAISASLNPMPLLVTAYRLAVAKSGEPNSLAPTRLP
jgi:hypothetical protein